MRISTEVKAKQGKDYRVIVKVKNANLLRAFEKAGFKSVNAFCQANNLNPSAVGELVNLKAAPTQGRHLAVAERISVALVIPLFELFSDEQLTPLTTNTSQIEVSLEDVLPLIEGTGSDPLQKLIEEDNRVAIHKALELLTQREAEVIKRRWGIYGETETYDAIAKGFGVTRERVRQIEHKAFRKLRDLQSVPILIDAAESMDINVKGTGKRPFRF